MSDINILAKRVRRTEVSDLIQAEEIVEIRASMRALYEAVLLISKRLPPAIIGSPVADVLIAPPWYKNELTGDVLPPPSGLDLEQAGLGILRAKLKLLSEEQLAEFHRLQFRAAALLEDLRKKEIERAAKLTKDGQTKDGPTM